MILKTYSLSCQIAEKSFFSQFILHPVSPPAATYTTYILKYKLMKFWYTGIIEWILL